MQPRSDFKGEVEEAYIDELVALLLEGKVRSKEDLHKAKLRLARKHKVKSIPADAQVLERIPEEAEPLLMPLLRTKAVRTVSGVAVVAAMTSPAKCPHGRCLYCPGGVDMGTAQSYTGREPAALRATMNNFDAFREVSSRLEQLHAIGHATDKIDLIIMGGTFTARDMTYQNEFVKGCFDAMNGRKAPDLPTALTWNETAPSRCIGLTVETRPDWFGRDIIVRSMDMGMTRVELGVQTLYDDVLKAMQRGHTVATAAEAIGNARNAGLKVGVHMMPGMPGVDERMELKAWDDLFTDPQFRPDMLKIYPCLVMKGTGIYDLWKEGKYEPFTTEQAIKILAKVKTRLPKWVRIQRIQRDIPVQLIEAGVDKSNLRELVQARMAEEGTRCRCIRCREVGHRTLRGDKVDEKAVEFLEERYEACGGTEVFVSFEDTANDILISYLRLRFPGEGNWWRPRTEGCAFVREMKVLGEVVPIGKHDEKAWQHAGRGQELLGRAEAIAKESFGAERLLVTSGVGAREYYRRMGYERSGPYMGKSLKT
jgi:elongator complex protein 3